MVITSIFRNEQVMKMKGPVGNRQGKIGREREKLENVGVASMMYLDHTQFLWNKRLKILRKLYNQSTLDTVQSQTCKAVTILLCKWHITATLCICG